MFLAAELYTCNCWVIKKQNMMINSPLFVIVVSQESNRLSWKKSKALHRICAVANCNNRKIPAYFWFTWCNIRWTNALFNKNLRRGKVPAQKELCLSLLLWPWFVLAFCNKQAVHMCRTKALKEPYLQPKKQNRKPKSTRVWQDLCVEHTLYCTVALYKPQFT